MLYKVTSQQGRTVRTIRSQAEAEDYIRTLIRQGVSYSIERR